LLTPMFSIEPKKACKAACGVKQNTYTACRKDVRVLSFDAPIGTRANKYEKMMNSGIAFLAEFVYTYLV